MPRILEKYSTYMRKPRITGCMLLPVDAFIISDERAHDKGIDLLVTGNAGKTIRTLSEQNPSRETPSPIGPRRQQTPGPGGNRVMAKSLQRVVHGVRTSRVCHSRRSGLNHVLLWSVLRYGGLNAVVGALAGALCAPGD